MLSVTGGAPVVAGAKILAPIPRPPKNVFCVGKNYHEHAKEFAGSGFDGGASLQEMMGDEAYKNYLKVVAEIVTTTEVSILAVNPELSSPPAETAAAAPSFWRSPCSPAWIMKPWLAWATPPNRAKWPSTWHVSPNPVA